MGPLEPATEEKNTADPFFILLAKLASRKYDENKFVVITSLNSSSEVPCNGFINIEPIQLTSPLISTSLSIIFENSLGSGVFVKSITSYLQLYLSACSFNLDSSL